MAARTVVRCNLNKYQSPLFSFDEKGIYLHCKDCRRDTDNGPRRGAYHLVTWAQVLSIMATATRQSLMGLFPASEVQNGPRSPIPGSNFIFDEVAVADNGHRRRGGEGEELDGGGLRLSGGQDSDSEDDTTA